MKSETKPLMRRIAAFARAAEGVSIIEVLVAALIFTLVSIGVAQATVNTVRLAGDQRHRVTALSLAASEIDYVRSLRDPFAVVTRPEPLVTVIDGITYRTFRETEWVSSTGTDIPCGGNGTANLQLKRVNVSVEWSGQLTATLPVSSDTVLAPDSRINDADLGTITVAAINSDGIGSEGVDVTIAPVTGGGGTALAAQPPDTNTAGCTYALKVKPGKYTVTLSRSNYVDQDEFAATPVRIVDVVKGQSNPVTVIYERGATYVLTYAPGAPANTKFPTNTNLSNPDNVFTVSYTSTDDVVHTLATPGTANPSTVKVFPSSAGYSVIAGNYEQTQADGCAALDPRAWLAGKVNNVNLGDGTLGDPIPAVSGTSTAVPVRMGTLTVRSTSGGYLFAKSADPIAGTGNPGCSATFNLEFGNVLSANTNLSIALPFGSWTIYRANSLTGTRTPLTNLTPTSNVAPGLVSGTTVTLDPRPAA